MKATGLLTLSLALALPIPGATALAQDSHASCAAHEAHETPAAHDHHAGVDERGDHVMGFSHDKTTHHFLLTKDGGVIEVSANDASDADSRDLIRGHLGHIAKMFAAGDFDAPMLIHDRVPPGVPTLQKKKASIHWRFEETEHGGRVVASTADPKALAAIHDFLRFQIDDHRTGDSKTISD
jgi:hypothetical protein